MSEFGEPWKIHSGNYGSEPTEGAVCCIKDKDGGWLGFGHSSDEGEIYVDRITKRVVACVNACQGIPTEVLEKLRFKPWADSIIAASEPIPENIHMPIYGLKGGNYARVVLDPPQPPESEK